MPEIPDLEAAKDVLRARTLGRAIRAISVYKPLVIRSLTGEDVQQALPDQTVSAIHRRGKYLIFRLDRHSLVINPMITGRFQFCMPETRRSADTIFALRLSSGEELRYIDDKSMGKVYLVRGEQYGGIPRFTDQGPDALDPDLTYKTFQTRLKQHHGEIKGILTNARFITGIGNAYADEILFSAGIYPFRKRKSLTEDETQKLYRSIHAVLKEAIAVVKERMGDQIQLKIRDFLKVHAKAGSACPRCGGRIAGVKARQLETNFCRRCQPGLLVEPRIRSPIET
ncbi:MAG TPA: DNA-formamidopyrimidine glycosylase family protein [Nitrospiria bacterium]|jgi:formamidopyrimidine-DNA glycosylase|nr:DNA-formamidopyrimidine glycosylase family protein [Nitrospiria bacterium]